MVISSGFIHYISLNIAKNFAKWPNSKSSKVAFCLSSSSSSSLTMLRQNLLTQMKQFFHENTARELD